MIKLKEEKIKEIDEISKHYSGSLISFKSFVKACMLAMEARDLGLKSKDIK